MCSKSIFTLIAVSVLLWLPAAMGATPNCGCDFTPVQTELIRGGDGFLGLKVQHGIVPVEGDGSAHFCVPAMRNIYFQAFDENLLAVQTARTYVHYMPGEIRSCVGCHETPNQTQRPATGALLAMMRPPSIPSPQPGEATAAKLFDYDRQIQPIWDRHCVECHNSEILDGDLNLRGDPRECTASPTTTLSNCRRAKNNCSGTVSRGTRTSGRRELSTLRPTRSAH